MRTSEGVITETRFKTIALLGTPNSGKTTLYNWLTGSRFKTVNYPGATVEFSLGKLASHWGAQDLQVMDTPGTYSLHPKSADEWVTFRSIYENPRVPSVDGLIVVVDGTQLARHLQLAMQVKETGFPFMVVITMEDLLRKEGLNLDIDYLKKELGCPVLLFDGLLAGGIKEIVAQAHTLSSDKEIFTQKPQPWNFETQEKRLQECAKIADEALTHKTDHAQERLHRIVARTEKIDKVLLHPWLGSVLFVVIMSLLFASVFWVATPFMDFIDESFTSLNEWVAALGPGTLWADFLANGIVASFAAFLVFAPQIFILFLGIGILESTGYLARAATLIDRPFSALGMSGRSFVPLLSGFACAVPAIIATRNIPSTKDRMITNFVIPLMSCSARLPVYALCLAFLFRGDPLKAGLALAALYIGSMIVGAFAAGVVSKFIPAREATLFMMELPIYRRPKLRVLLRQAWTRTLSYIKRAGPIIFVFAVIVWAGSTFPHYEMEDAHQKLEESYIGRMGKVIEPVMAPMGVDWRVGVGLISAFAAREVFVSSMALTFNITDTDEDTQQASLLTQMENAVNSSGEKIFTVSSVIGLMVFFLIALQCMSTVGVQVRESGSWTFALTQLVAFNLFAYVLVVVLVQGLRLIGVP